MRYTIIDNESREVIMKEIESDEFEDWMNQHEYLHIVHSEIWRAKDYFQIDLVLYVSNLDN